MIKKMIISTAIIGAVIASGSVIYVQADNTASEEKDTPVYEIVEENLESKTFESEHVISGNAEEGTAFSLSLYWFKADDEQSIVVKKKESDEKEKSGDWLLQDSEEWEVGPSGIFVQPIKLEIGKNKIILNIVAPSGIEDEKEWEIELQDKEHVTDYINSYILKDINKDIEDDPLQE